MLTLFQNAQNNMQYLMSVTSQLRNPLRLIGMVAKTATSSDTTKQSPQIHICRQHIQMLRPKQLFLTSNSDLNVPFCSKLSAHCLFETTNRAIINDPDLLVVEHQSDLLHIYLSKTDLGLPISTFLKLLDSLSPSLCLKVCLLSQFHLSPYLLIE